VLAELLRDRGLAPVVTASVDVFLAGVTEEDLSHVLALTHELRDAGVRTEYALSPQSVGKQLKLAGSRGARMAIVIGPDDRTRGEVVVKDMMDGTQSSVAQDAAVTFVADQLRKAPAVASGTAREG
jgi:histidyl-tRNA synthetase